MMKYVIIIFLDTMMLYFSTGTGEILPPHIHVHPKAKIIYKDHDHIILDCEAVANPKAKFYWKKNGRILSDKFVNFVSPTKGTVMINIAVESDEGFYQCFAENIFGTSMSRVAEVRRAVLERMVSQPSLSYYQIQRGVPFKLECMIAKSYPEPIFSWDVITAMNDPSVPAIPVPLDQRVQVDRQGNLYFAHIKFSDSHHTMAYRCAVNNKFLGTKITGNYFNVTVVSGRTAVRDLVRPKLVYSHPQMSEPAIAIDGQSVYMQCIFDGCPTPSVTWIKVNDTLPEGRYTLRDSGTTLIINNTEPRDQGQYKCIGTVTQKENVYKEEVTIQLEVHSIPKFKSKFSRPHSSTRLVGMPAVFVCDVTGRPKPHVQWFINGVPTEELKNPRLGISSNRKILTIKDVCLKCSDNSSDVGVIQCNASNIHGYVYGEGYLKVIGFTTNDITGNGHTDIVPTESPHHVKTGLIIGISIAVGISGVSVVVIIIFFYCRSKRLERELTTLRMTVRKPPHHHHHQQRQVSSNNSSSLYDKPNEEYEKLNRNTYTSINTDNPNSYQDLQVPVNNTDCKKTINLIDDTYKYDYAYEGAEKCDSALLGGNVYDSHRPPSSAYIDIIDSEELNLNADKG